MELKMELNQDELEKASGGTGENARFFTHIVEKGETLHKIARRYGVSVDDLVRWNNIKNRNLIYIGQELKIFE